MIFFDFYNPYSSKNPLWKKTLALALKYFGDLLLLGLILSVFILKTAIFKISLLFASTS